MSEAVAIAAGAEALIELIDQLLAARQAAIAAQQEADRDAAIARMDALFAEIAARRAPSVNAEGEMRNAEDGTTAVSTAGFVGGGT